MNENIDHWGHFGGFLGGGALSLLCAPRDMTMDLSQEKLRHCRLYACAGLSLFGIVASYFAFGLGHLVEGANEKSRVRGQCESLLSFYKA